jgi:hypothetical protein
MRALRLAAAAVVLAAAVAPAVASADPLLPCQVHPPVFHVGPGVFLTVEKPWVDCT